MDLSRRNVIGAGKRRWRPPTRALLPAALGALCFLAGMLIGAPLIRAGDRASPGPFGASSLAVKPEISLTPVAPSRADLGLRTPDTPEISIVAPSNPKALADRPAGPPKKHKPRKRRVQAPPTTPKEEVIEIYRVPDDAEEPYPVEEDRSEDRPPEPDGEPE